MRKLIRLPLIPVLFALRLTLACSAFVVSISASLLGLLLHVFPLMAALQFLIGWWKNGIIFLVLSWLVSPIGLPGIANLMLFLADHALGAVERIVL